MLGSTRPADLPVERPARILLAVNLKTAAALGVSVAPLTPELASRLGAPKDAAGLVVEDVDPEGRAADAGIEPGDIIQSVNRHSVKTVDELRDAVTQSRDKPVLMLITRQGRSVFVTVRPANG